MSAFSITQTHLPMANYGDWTTYAAEQEGQEALILESPVEKTAVPWVRIHSSCITGDVFGSQRCDCGLQLKKARELLTTTYGFIIYLLQEGRGIGLFNKMKAYALQDEGLDTVDANHALGFEADARQYDLAIAILHYFDIKDLHLLTNNPKKIQTLTDAGFCVKRSPLYVEYHQANEHYMQTKQEKLGHLLGGSL